MPTYPIAGEVIYTHTLVTIERNDDDNPHEISLDYDLIWTPPDQLLPPIYNQYNIYWLFAHRQINAIYTATVSGRMERGLGGNDCRVEVKIRNGSNILGPYVFSQAGQNNPYIFTDLSFSPPLTGLDLTKGSSVIYTKTNGGELQIITTIHVSFVVLEVCEGESLVRDNIYHQDTSYCYQKCIKDGTNCLQDYLTYCFGDRGPDDNYVPWPLDDKCVSYFAGISPHPDLDTKLNLYCQTKFATFEDLQTRGDYSYGGITEENLCACHLKEDQYTHLLGVLQSDDSLKGIGFLGLDKHCMYSPCASSAFKLYSMTNLTDGRTRCDQLQCINIVQFDANGDFSGADINIIQDGSQCATLAKSGSGNDIPSDFTGWYVAGAIFIILIILILVIVILRRKTPT